MHVLETHGICKTFRQKREKINALKDVDIKVEKGEIFGLLGPNGAGKTTLINILTTLITPTSGTAEIMGFDLLKQPNEVRENVGLCYGGSRFQWDFTPIEILNYYGMLLGLGRQERERRIKSLLKDLDITKFVGKKYYALSTGMKQKVAIAKSLLNDPPIVFMDEPTIGLDVDVSIDVRNYLRRLAKNTGKTIVLTSHNMHEVEVLCESVALIHRGRIIEHGKISDIKKKLKFPDTIYLQVDGKDAKFLRSIKGVRKIFRNENGVFIETHDTQDVLERMMSGLKKRKIRIQDIEVRKATLEDAFLKIVGDENV